MRLLIDTNVVLDVMLKREPFYKSGAEILKLADRVSIQLFVSASSVTDIYYISRKCLGSRLKAKEALEKLFSVVSVAGVTEDEIKQAMLMDWKDFEDSRYTEFTQKSETDILYTTDFFYIGFGIFFVIFRSFFMKLALLEGLQSECFSGTLMPMGSGYWMNDKRK